MTPIVSKRHGGADGIRAITSAQRARPLPADALRRLAVASADDFEALLAIVRWAVQAKAHAENAISLVRSSHQLS